MAHPDEVEMICKKCGHLHWETKANAISFTVTCGVCGTPMRKTGQKKENGELVVPEPLKAVPTMIPAQKVIDSPGEPV